MTTLLSGTKKALPPVDAMPGSVEAETLMLLDHKVWFSAERTYVVWIHLAAKIGLVALGLFAIRQTDYILTATFLAVPAIFFVVWSAFMYRRRCTALRLRDSDAIEDKLGPLLAVWVMSAVVLTSCGLGWWNYLVGGETDRDEP